MDYDLVVIGGGIHGVGVAQAAAVKGYRVALVEKSDLATGTSSRSSKLIHGGLRYLESAQFGLVKECLHERQTLLSIAPHLVKLRPFCIPVYEGTTRQATSLHLGLMLYGVFTGVDRSARYKKIPKHRWSELDGLETKGLKHVFQYWDAQTDDVLLTRSVMQSAIDHGAELFTQTALKKARRDGDVWALNILQGQTEKEIRARVIVNATGPWVNRVLDLFESPHAKEEVDLVQGTHIILPHELSSVIYYLEAPKDKRAVFVMPWYGQTMVGTTETVFEGSPDDVVPLDAEIRYLLETVAHYFPGIPHQGNNVEKAFAGLRVLPSGGHAAFSRPRETILKCDNDSSPKLLSIYGGKLTAYRATAERVIKRLSASLGPAQTQMDTGDIMLPENTHLT